MGINFQKLFNDYKKPVRLSKGWVNVNCPFCKMPPDTHCNLGFSTDVPSSNCWRCGKHGWVESLALILNVSPIEVRRIVSNYTVGTQKIIRKKSSGKNLVLPGSSTLTVGEENYLKERGYNIPYLQKKFGIKGGGLFGEWSYRIIIPLFYNGTLVSWVGRTILPKEFIKENNIPRYKNLSIEASEINPKSIFFNLDNSRDKKVILVEGPFDVLKMGDNTICSLGTSVTSQQKLLLLQRYEKIFIAFDNEPSAQEKARKLGIELDAVGLDVEVVNICEDYDCNDPGELNQKQVREIKSQLF